MSDQDYSAGLDGLQSDMAEHQRRHVGEVKAESNRLLAVDAIQRLENENAEKKPAPQVAPMQQAPIETTRERREVNGSKYLLKKEADTTLVREANPHEAWFLSHAMPRVSLLLTKHDTGPLGQPSWRQRVLAVLGIQTHASSLRAAAEDPTMFAAQKLDIERMQPLERAEVLKAIGADSITDLTPAFARRKAAELERKFLGLLCKVLEESSAVFGDWKKDAPKKLQVG